MIEREERIDAEVKKTRDAAAKSVLLAIEQGQDLLLAKHKVKHGEWENWLKDHFPKTARLAQQYMVLAVEAKKQGQDFFLNAKSISEAFRLLGLLPEIPTPKQIEMPGVSIPPIIQRLNFVAEWVTKEGEELKTWDPERRRELKRRLEPVVKLYEQLD